ncbi:hypothetical protein BDV95DRAFT_612765 [Massariosphaeria phaeospora]|uniref:ferroxidase n=1 Tax=Massariosphaeria phaeospora TaxID=100035 RepID=A0A7C8M020_9PLEO|nr:hypothetical protein BDV95DRAFT_612765 [Massariosphaeria phaeospora]
MSLNSLSRVGRAGLRRTIRVSVRSQTPTNCIIPRASVVPAILRSNVAPSTSIRTFHASTAYGIGIMPESDNPPPPDVQASEQPTVPTDISSAEYHERADAYLEELVNKLEAAQEKRPDLDVEYSAGVLQISAGSVGEYVINKQPNNKQIWLSSPISGPFRFDWVVVGESMHQKEGAGVGDWIYLRDSTSLSDIIRKELGVELSVDDSVPQ